MSPVRMPSDVFPDGIHPKPCFTVIIPIPTLAKVITKVIAWMTGKTYATP